MCDKQLNQEYIFYVFQLCIETIPLVSGTQNPLASFSSFLSPLSIVPGGFSAKYME